jgi:hypothetical protein
MEYTGRPPGPERVERVDRTERPERPDPAQDSLVEAVVERVFKGLPAQIGKQLAELVGEAVHADESTIEARVDAGTRSQTRRLKITAGGLATALFGVVVWLASQVQSYGDSRAAAAAAALKAEAKAADAQRYMEETRGLAEAASASAAAASESVRSLKGKLDQLIELVRSETPAAPPAIVPPRKPRR